MSEQIELTRELELAYADLYAANGSLYMIQGSLATNEHLDCPDCQEILRDAEQDVARTMAEIDRLESLQ